MARAKTTYRCQGCGAVEPKWAGRCSACEAWGSLVEERAQDRPSAAVGPTDSVPLPIAEVDAVAWAPAPTHVGELDRVLQGGLVPGSVTVLGGERRRQRAMRGLDRAHGVLQRRIARELHLRRTPQLIFQYDGGVDRAMRITELLESAGPPAVGSDADDTRE